MQKSGSLAPMTPDPLGSKGLRVPPLSITTPISTPNAGALSTQLLVNLPLHAEVKQCPGS